MPAIIFVLGVIIFNVVLGGLATEYVIEFWMPYIVNHPVDIAFWLAAIAGLFLGEIMVPAAIVTLLIAAVI